MLVPAFISPSFIITVPSTLPLPIIFFPYRVPSHISGANMQVYVYNDLSFTFCAEMPQTAAEVTTYNL